MSPLALLLSVAMVLAAAESPFVGKWKLNPAKSQFAGTTMAFEQLPSGETRMSAQGQSYTFRTDGKEYPAFFGATAAWKQLDPNSWQATYKFNEKVVSTETMKVSADGRTLSVDIKGTKPDGTSYTDAATFERVSGGPGLDGKWKSTKVTISSPDTIEFAPYEGDGLSFNVPAYKVAANLKFDGKDVVVEGPTVPKNYTVALTSKGPHSFEMIEKMSGKVVYRGTYTLSEDGKTLTAVSTPEGTNEKITAVYDRQ